MRNIEGLRRKSEDRRLRHRCESSRKRSPDLSGIYDCCVKAFVVTICLELHQPLALIKLKNACFRPCFPSPTLICAVLFYSVLFRYMALLCIMLYGPGLRFFLGAAWLGSAGLALFLTRLDTGRCFCWSGSAWLVLFGSASAGLARRCGFGWLGFVLVLPGFLAWLGLPVSSPARPARAKPSHGIRSFYTSLYCLILSSAVLYALFVHRYYISTNFWIIQ